jgi:hypothetical protein
VGHVARIRDIKKAYKISVGKFKGKIPPWRPRYGSEDNIKGNLHHIYVMRLWTGFMWLKLGTRYLVDVNTEMILRVPQLGGNILTN